MTDNRWSMVTATAEWPQSTPSGHSAKRIEITCPHGTTSAIVLPVDDARANLLALGYVRARHSARCHCECAAEGPELPAADA